MDGWKDRFGSVAWGTGLLALTCLVGPLLFVEHLARVVGLTP